MRKLEFAHYYYYKKMHFITGSKGRHKSCIYCGSFYGDTPIEEFRKGEIYQIPYCSRKCEIEDTESARIIDEYIKTCNIYKNFMVTPSKLFYLAPKLPLLSILKVSTLELLPVLVVKSLN